MKVQLRFSLRTLFILVAIFCLPAAWIGNQLMWIHERHAALDFREENGWSVFMVTGYSIRHMTSAPWQLRIFGERGETGILMPNTDQRPALKQRLAELFPEAKIYDVPDRHPTPALIPAASRRF